VFSVFPVGQRCWSEAVKKFKFRCAIGYFVRI
jgi:hypothetical protein